MAKSEAKKPKRQKKRKSRTEVSSDSDSEVSVSSPAKTKEETSSQSKQIPSESSTVPETATKARSSQSDEQVKNAFSQFYMQRATVEFAEDLDRVREAEDFKGVESVEVLIRALRQGVDGWGMEEMRRVVGERV